MRARSMLAALPGLLPWILSALWPAFAPAQALLVALALRHGPPRARSGRAIAQDFLALAAPWWVLRALRPDAGLLTGAGILLAGLLLELLRARPAGARAARVLIALLLAGPLSLTFFCRLAELPPPALAVQADPWRLAAAPPAEPVRYDMAGTVWFAPARVEPWPLSPAADAGSRRRGLLLLAAVCGAALWLQLSRSPVALLTVLAAAAGPLAARPAPRTVVLDPGQEGAPVLIVELAAGFRAGAAQTWDPQREGPPDGIQVRAAAEFTPASAPDLAWLERHPLRAPQEEGPPGAVRLLSWYAGADQASGAARWSLRPDGRLVRRRLQP